MDVELLLSILVVFTIASLCTFLISELIDEARYK